MTDVATLSVTIEVDSKDLDAGMRRIQQQVDRLGKERVNLGGAFDDATPAIKRAEVATLNFARARAGLLRDQGNLAGAERVLQGALNGTTRSTTQTIAVERQLLKVRQELERSSSGAATGSGRFAGALSGIASAAGALGIGLGVSAIAQFGLAAGGAALSLEKTQATLRAVAGSQERYNEVTRIASANQKLFGGTVEENLAPLQQFLFIANRSGASLDELNQAAQLLSTINPAEGFQGAGVALSEFFSGDVTSLAERFNLPRAALRELTAEGISAQDKLAGLETLLAGQGVTAETLAASLTSNAQAYNNLGAVASQAFTDMGGAAASAAAPIAEALGGAVVATSNHFKQLAANIEQANFDGLTGSARAYADAQVAAGASIGQAFAATTSFLPTLNAIGAAQEQVTTAWDGSAESATALGQRLTDLANTSAGNELTVRALAQAYADGKITIGELEASLNAIEISQRALTGTSQNLATADIDRANAANAAASATAAGAAATTEAAFAQLEQAAAAEQAALKHDELAAAIEAAAGSGGSAEAAAKRIADAFGLELPKVIALINAHRELAAARAGGASSAAVSAGTADQRAAERNLGRTSDLASGRAREVERLQSQALRFEQNLARASARSAGAGGGGGGGAKTSPATKAAEAQQRATEQLYTRLTNIQERFQESSITAEQTYQQRLTDIAAEFAEKRAAAEKSFSDAQFDSRASFYTSLASADKSQRTGLIQEFEAAQAKAAEIASTQGVDAGEAYLSAITQVIRDRAQRQADIAKALEGGDKAEAEAEAEFLKGVDAIARQAEQRKLDSITSGGNTLAGQEQAAVGEAAATREKALADATLTAQSALAEAEQAKADKAAITNEQLARQLELVTQIAQKGGAAVPAPAATATPTATAATVAATPTTAGAAATPAGVVTVASSPSVEALLSQAIDALGAVERALRSKPNYSPGA